MALKFMTPVGGSLATGSAQNSGYVNVGRGYGWQATISTTNTLGISGGVSNTIIIPQNARNASVTFSYNGAGTVTVDLQGTNNSVDEIAAGTAVYGKFPTSVSTQIAGGSSNSTAITVVLPSTPVGVRLLVGGAGAVGADTFTFTVSAVSYVAS